MAASRHSGLTSPFDEMLDQSRRQFDDLYGGSKGAPRPQSPAPQPSALESQNGQENVPEDTKRFLDDRYGSGWRYEVSERRRDGDEVIVLCRLIVGDGNVSKSQFGSATVGGERSGLKGSAGGIAFALGADAAPSPGGDPEEAAYRQALTTALEKCAEML
ncbi:MAG: hypothetical protein QF797_05725 [Alphaproteobacteria bacterium]|jgi:hypothetical protein|nr:hypothetical protein [Rhodospirillaceae bacterium]MDP6404685.1 hypothetical protein [Alphaproteobacteria bacterium]|tara:strand:+ start:53 stop:532 length:480 start_codon:yes stop_codon:yes gene_type:complete